MLFVVGYLWLLVIPSPLLGQRTYIDENALQPGQVRYLHALNALAPPSPYVCC